MADELPEILFVDDDVVTGKVMQRHCDNVKYDCKVFRNAKDCLDAFKQHNADVIVTDLRMPGMNGFDLLSEIRKIDPDVTVLIMTGYSSVENAVEAMKRGASDFIKKPFDFAELRLLIDRSLKISRLRRENKLLKRQLRLNTSNYGMTGNSEVMKNLYKELEKVAQVNCSAIVTGESGTGKELVARALHEYSPRKQAPFVTIDCGALNVSLLESELFGYEKGAFTGATQRKYGLLEQASGGTLFLDEICNISDAMQVKLMRAIDDMTITRVGSTQAIPIDVRIIAASNRNLEEMVELGELRHDFYHRLNVVNIHVPSLSERREDIPFLVKQFAREFAERYGRNINGFDEASLQALSQADWSGNVRELKNTIERSVIMADGPQLYWQGNETFSRAGSGLAIQFPTDEFFTLEALEQEYISHVLACCKGRKTRAAEVLGIDKTTLWRKLRRYEEEKSTMENAM